MRELSLFTGAGGGILGSKLLGWETVGYVELNEYCQKILAQRIKDGLIDNAPIFGDVRTFNDQGYAASYTGMVDVVSGGFPCPAFSTATHGKNDSEKDFWYETACTIEIVKPAFFFGENVSRQAIEQAAYDLNNLGYSCRSCKISASDMGADHIRKRYWIFAYTNNKGQLSSKINAKVECLQKFCCSIWKSGPDKSGVANGVANRVERLKAIGNGQVPAVVKAAWNLLSEGLTEHTKESERW